ncbi:type VI secretion protein [Streptomyces sp. NPDC002004]
MQDQGRGTGHGHEAGHGYEAGPGQRRAGGVPDGLLVGSLAFLLGMTLLVWTSTGLGALFARGSWPSAVTFAHTPLAMRHLIGQPHDLPGAWPDTPTEQLSGWGLFWGLFIGQLMVLLVLTLFGMGVVARWRARRAGRPHPARASASLAHAHGAKRPGTYYEAPGPAVPEPAAAAAAAGTSAVGPTEPTSPVPVAATAAHPAESRPGPESASPVEATVAHAESAVPQPATFDGGPAAQPGLPAPRTPVVLGPPASRRPVAVQAVRDADGPALVLTSDPTVWAETKDARAKLGPVLLYDPSHLCDTPARMHWSPTTGCEDKATAGRRAADLLAPVRPTAKVDSALADTAETLLRSFLHAAAVEGRQFRHVHRWAQGSGLQEAVRALRTNPRAAAGSAGELEAALTAHPERRDMAVELTARALSALFTVHVREACTPNRNDALALDSFVNEGGTLYVVGEAIEDPKSRPGAMPLLTALVSSVVEHGRRMAERSSSGRLDPPLALVLDDVAAVAPLRQLPELLTSGADRGMPALALLRSREQGRARWPHDDLPVPPL